MMVGARECIRCSALAPFVAREVESGRFTWSEIAMAVGYTRRDTSRVQRALGLKGGVTHGKTHVQEFVSIDVAARIAAAIMLDPVDVDGL